MVVILIKDIVDFFIVEYIPNFGIFVILGCSQNAGHGTFLESIKRVVMHQVVYQCIQCAAHHKMTDQHTGNHLRQRNHPCGKIRADLKRKLHPFKIIEEIP